MLSVPEHPDWSIGSALDDAGETLWVSLSQGTSPANRLWAVDLAAVPRGGRDGALDFAALDGEGGSGEKERKREEGPSPNLPLAKLVDDFESSYDYLATRALDGKAVFMTNADAPLYRLVVGDARAAVAAAAAKGGAAAGGRTRAPPPIGDWPDLVAQHPRHTLQFAKAMKGDEALVLGYLEDVATVLRHGSLVDGLGAAGGEGGGAAAGTVPLPPLGSVGDLSGDREDSVLFFTYTSFVDPGTTYSYDTAGVASEREEARRRRTSSSPPSTAAAAAAAATTKSVAEDKRASSGPAEPAVAPIPAASEALKVFRQTQVPDYDRREYKTERVFATSRDGTRVPVFVTRLANASFDGRRPTVLYGYGGFNIAVKPSFSVSRMLWIRSFNAAYASANMRGGEEERFFFFFLGVFFLFSLFFQVEVEVARRGGKRGSKKTKNSLSFLPLSHSNPPPPFPRGQAASTVSPGATPAPAPSRSKRCSTTSRPPPSTSSPGST